MMKIGACLLCDVKYEIAGQYVRDSGCTSSRNWIGFNDFVYKPHNLAARQAEYWRKGIDQLFTFAQEGMVDGAIDASKVRDYATQHVLHLASLLKPTEARPLRIGIGNEINLMFGSKGHYWTSGNVFSFIKKVQKPFFDAAVNTLGKRVRVVCNSPSWDHKILEAMADVCMDSSHEFGFHPYCKNVTPSGLERIKRSVETAKKRGRRIIYDECQMDYGKAFDAGTIERYQWRKDAVTMFKCCRTSGVDEVYYFVTYDAGTTNSPAALMTRRIVNNSTVSVAPTMFFGVPAEVYK